MIEAHIDYVDENGRSVHLPTQFVRHYMRRDDGVLPTIVAIAQSADHSRRRRRPRHGGWHRSRPRHHVRIPKELMRCLPRRDDCTADRRRRAMRFLCDDWLYDVSLQLRQQVRHDRRCAVPDRAFAAAEQAGILRHCRPSRQRQDDGSAHADDGRIRHARSRAAWSPNEEERRKALLRLSIMGRHTSSGTISRAAARSAARISSAHAPRHTIPTASSASARSYRSPPRPSICSPGTTSQRRATRLLARSRRRSWRIAPTPRIGPIKHNDPIGWTEAHRGQIMAALYTILLGNPFLRAPIDAECKTRFKIWWRLCGSAVENAAKQHTQWRKSEIDDLEKVFPGDRDDQWRQRRADADIDELPPQPKEIDFKSLFLVQEETDEESASLADLLELMVWKWPRTTRRRPLRYRPTP